MADQKGRRTKPVRKERVATAVLANPASESNLIVEPAQKPSAPIVAAPAPVEAAAVAAPAVEAAAPQQIEAEPVAAAAPAAPEPAIAPKAADQVKEAITENVDQGASIMNETIEKAREATQQTAAQFQNAMGETSQQAKAAMEKGARVAEEMAELTRGNIEALVASSKTAAKYVETLTQGAADYGRRSFEEASTALRSFAEVKSPTDFFRLQSDFARSQFDSMVAESARVSETMVKMSGDVAEPITSRYSVAAERMKTLAA